MTTTTRALHLTTAGAQAADVRRFYAELFGDRVGVIGDGLTVTEKSGTPDMSVDVAGGFALAAGTQSASQGSYVVENVGVQNVTIATADVTNDRHDLICAYVTDTDEGAGSSTAVIGATTGTPAASPADPTEPDNAVVLARVVVPSSASSITDSDITDLRTSWTGQSTALPVGGTRVLSSTSAAPSAITSSGWITAVSCPSFVAKADHAYRVTFRSGGWKSDNDTTVNMVWRVTGITSTAKHLCQATHVPDTVTTQDVMFGAGTALYVPSELVAGTTYTPVVKVKEEENDGTNPVRAATDSNHDDNEECVIEEIYAPGV